MREIDQCMAPARHFNQAVIANAIKIHLALAHFKTKLPGLLRRYPRRFADVAQGVLHGIRLVNIERN